MELKGSKTEKNLMDAFAGESMARNKYTYYASKAKKEGYNIIADKFEQTANNEKEHAKIWFKLLHGGAVADTMTNLKDAAAGENYEWTDMYARMAKEAREEGDLKENAGYDAARERQGMLEARIKYIESRMALFNVIDLSTLSSEKAIFGATVTVEDADTGEEREFTLLGPDEADYAKGTISIQSPVGVALLGKEVGDEITVNAPRGRINYEIIDIQFKKKTA